MYVSLPAEPVVTWPPGERQPEHDRQDTVHVVLAEPLRHIHLQLFNIWSHVYRFTNACIVGSARMEWKGVLRLHAQGMYLMHTPVQRADG